MANPEHVKIVRRGTEAIAEWRRLNTGVRLDLTGADLSMVELIKTDLTGANLFGANLFGVDLRFADLSGTNLSKTDLTGANLFEANLSKADLTEADLSGAYLFEANLSKADLTRARLGWTSVSNVDLSQVDGVETVIHHRPSSIGIDTLIASLRGAGNRLTPDLRTFFRGAGVPAELLDALPGIVSEVKYYNCFVAYGQPNVEFARKLCQDLEARGVSKCWLYDTDQTPGERTWQEIGQKRREADKVVVLCSFRALMRPGILKEIEEQLDEDSDKLVPVSLDDDWKEPHFPVARGDRDLKPFLRERNYADFANMSYEDALKRLLVALSRRDTGAT